MSKKRKYLPNSLKESIVSLHLKKGKTLAELSKEYNVPIPTIYSWVAKNRKENDPKSVESSNKDEEIKRLKRQLVDITEERDILKKVAAIYSRK